MLKIEKLLSERPTIRAVADSAEIDPATLSRIIHGKQAPSFREGGSAERIAKAIGWTGEVSELFKEVD